MNPATKPSKPSPDFPLFAHACGKWAKKIQGSLRYFGRWDDPDGALQEYRSYIDAVTIERDVTSYLALGDACNLFLDAKEQAVERNELSIHSYSDYKRTAIALCKHIGRDRPAESLRPEDFAAYKAKLAETRTVGSLGNEITRVRVMFKWFWDARLISQPMHFGPDFRKPSAKVMRRHRRQRGKKLFTSGEILRLMDDAGVHFRAMILLGINGGLGPTDLARLPRTLEIRSGWLDYPRPKTEIDRRVPLWRETRVALARSLKRRPEPRTGAENSFFLRPDGNPWTGPKITARFNLIRRTALLSLGSFYWLRHCCETIGGGAKDQIALNLIMGHCDNSMAAVYREGIDDERLIAVSEHIRRWLFAKPSKVNGAAAG